MTTEIHLSNHGWRLLIPWCVMFLNTDCTDNTDRSLRLGDSCLFLLPRIMSVDSWCVGFWTRIARITRISLWDLEIRVICGIRVCFSFTGVLPFYTRIPQIHSTITSLSEALYMASKMLLQEISRETFEFGSGENQEVVVIHQPIICLGSLGRQGHLPNSPRNRLTFQYALFHTDYWFSLGREAGAGWGGGKCPCKTGLKRHRWLLPKVILDTWQSNTGYLAK